MSLIELYCCLWICMPNIDIYIHLYPNHAQNNSLLWKAWPRGSRTLNNIFKSFHYHLLTVCNLRSRLLFKSIEVCSHLRACSFVCTARFPFNLCLVRWQRLLDGWTLLAFSGEAAGAFKRHTQVSAAGGRHEDDGTDRTMEVFKQRGQCWTHTQTNLLSA